MAPDENPAVVIAERLTNIEVELRHALASLTDHDTRLNRLERFMWLVLGISIATGIPNAITLLQQ